MLRAADRCRETSKNPLIRPPGSAASGSQRAARCSCSIRRGASDARTTSSTMTVPTIAGAPISRTGHPKYPYATSTATSSMATTIAPIRSTAALPSST